MKKIFHHKRLIGIGLVWLLTVSACACPEKKDSAQAATGGGIIEDGTATPPSSAGTGEFAPDELLVKFEPDKSGETTTALKNELNLEIIEVITPPDLYLMKITDGTDVEKILDRLKNYPGVVYAEPNAIQKLD